MRFAEEFAENRGQPIVVDGQEVQPMLRRTVQPGGRVTVIWRRTIPVPIQGIRLKVQRGKLAMGDDVLSDIVLWRDTAPDETVFRCHATHAVEVRIWNCWRDDHGVMQAWVGNAAMRSRETGPNVVTVECNSRSEVTFADLVFDVIIDEP